MGLLNSIRKALWSNIDTQEESFVTWSRDGIPVRTKAQLLKEYRLLVYSCVNLNSENVAKYQIVIKKKNAKGELEKTNHDFINVFENPGNGMSTYELLYATEAYLELVGEAFWYAQLGEMSRKPKGFKIMRPDRVTKLIDQTTKELIGYEYHTEDGTTVPLDIDEVVPFNNFSPYSKHEGTSPTQAGALYIETENSTSLFQRNFMKNQASPSGVLSLSKQITKDAFAKVKRKWKEQSEGLANVGKTLIIRGGDAKFEKIGLSLSELDMGQLKNHTKQDVLDMYRVPKALLGETDSVGLGRNNIEAIEFVYANYTIDPKQIRIDSTLERMIRLHWYKDANIYVEHVSQVPENREAKIAEYERGVDKWITRNEIRQEEGREDVQGGDSLYVGFNQVPVDGQAPQAQKAITLTLARKHEHEHTAVTKDTATENFFQALGKLEAKAAKEYRKELNKSLDRQKDEVITRLGAIASKAYEELIPDPGQEALLATAEIAPVILRALQVAGDITIEYLERPDVEFILSQGIQDAIFDSTERLLKSFNEETLLKLQKQLAEGVANGETKAQLAKRVTSVYQEAQGYRAERIAQTEGHKAVNYGASEVYKMAGYKKMRWVANAGACEFCQAMDGTVIDIGQSFVPKGDSIIGTDGGTYLNDYADIKYADAHPNCTCYLTPV